MAVSAEWSPEPRATRPASSCASRSSRCGRCREEVPLKAIKADPRFADLALVRQSRLSVHAGRRRALAAPLRHGRPRAVSAAASRWEASRPVLAALAVGAGGRAAVRRAAPAAALDAGRHAGHHGRQHGRAAAARSRPGRGRRRSPSWACCSAAASRARWRPGCRDWLPSLAALPVYILVIGAAGAGLPAPGRPARPADRVLLRHARRPRRDGHPRRPRRRRPADDLAGPRHPHPAGRVHRAAGVPAARATCRPGGSAAPARRRRGARPRRRWRPAASPASTAGGCCGCRPPACSGRWLLSAAAHLAGLVAGGAAALAGGGGAGGDRRLGRLPLRGLPGGPGAVDDAGRPRAHRR